MVVINPVILAGGRRAALFNQAQSADILTGRAAYDHLGNQVEGSLTQLAATATRAEMMVGTYRQTVPLYRYGITVPTEAPAIYILRPGSYSLQNNSFDSTLLEPYALEKPQFKRMVMGGNIKLNSTAKYINFSCVFDRGYQADYLRGFCYMADVFVERALPIIYGDQNKAAVVLAQLYALYCDQLYLTPETMRDNHWSAYSTLTLHYMYYEE